MESVVEVPVESKVEEAPKQEKQPLTRQQERASYREKMKQDRKKVTDQMEMRKRMQQPVTFAQFMSQNQALEQYTKSMSESFKDITYKLNNVIAYHISLCKMLDAKGIIPKADLEKEVDSFIAEQQKAHEEKLKARQEELKSRAPIATAVKPASAPIVPEVKSEEVIPVKAEEVKA